MGQQKQTKGATSKQTKAESPPPVIRSDTLSQKVEQITDRKLSRQIEDRIKLFSESPHRPPRILRDALIKKLHDVRHFWVNGTYRIWYIMQKRDGRTTYILTDFMDHKEQDRRIGK